MPRREISEEEAFERARPAMEAFGRNDWQASPPPERYRRGLHTFIIRTAPFAQSITFDAPNPNQVCAQRARSNTPLQALTLLNDPVFFEMAQAMSRRVLSRELGSDLERIDYAFRLCMARSPDQKEIQRLFSFLSRQQQLFASEPKAAQALIDEQISNGPQRAAWTNVCSVLLNLHEFITRN